MAPKEAILDPDLPICDPHHHLWDRDPGGRYLLPDLLEDLGAGHRIESTVFIEAGAFYSQHRPPHLRSVGETEFAAGMAAMADSGRYGSTRICAGIVGYAELSLGAKVAEVLEAHIAAAGGRFRGIRDRGAHDLEAYPASTAPPGLYGQAAFREGFARLAEHGLSYEAWQFHTQARDVIDLAKAFPGTPIMVNHLNTPLATGRFAGKRDEVFQTWSADIREMGKLPNLWMKLGGLGMHFNGPPAGKTSTELAAAWAPYLETAIEAFGTNRAVFESNFPVDRQSCGYDVIWNTFKRVATGCGADEKAKLFRDNAMNFYRLKL